ncbi:alpha/beta fold hydrolase [Actinophytocola xanthii]|uniref:Alpha/beta hydrolase n=1 Tax=Actinophytocola xanthii TaxID=1912961 RepID=A0A1Q8CY29_9PSEU|nr:alpha/beta fold hydrolase [Actinophytocola xanthii]OLF19252.1 alpha/beta hydrolase [Actinophytocola xanthii]
MTRTSTVSAAVALCATVALAGCDEAPEAAEPPPPTDTVTTARQEQAFSGTEKIQVDGLAVNVSCSGEPTGGRPVIVLLHGAGDGVDKLADLQRTLSEEDMVCSYDRLGAGASDKPAGPQILEDTGEVLTAVIDRVAGDAPVVLAGHSLGGLIAARYAPDHQDRVAGLVLLDATSPTQAADLEAQIPADATGPAADVRAQTLAMLAGQNPELLTVPDGEVRAAGDIPVEVVQHGKPYLAALPEYGPGLEQAWAEGQRAWLTVSSASNLTTAAGSEHYVYLDEPELVVRAIHRVADEAVS